MISPFSDDLFPKGPHGFPFPDWEAIAASLEVRCPEDQWHAEWVHLARQFTTSIQAALPSGYVIRESSNFILLSCADPRKAEKALQDLERIDAKLRDTIPALLPGKLYGKCPVLVFASQQHFYEYVSMFMGEDGDYAGMGGVFLDRGYGHFAMPSADFSLYLAVFAHELCHAYLGHLGLPLWLNEAITCGVEDSAAGTNPYHLDRETISRHRAYWTEDRIASFWSGESFYFNDDGQELSYHLARFILQALYRGGNTPRSAMEEFFLTACYEDAGQAAATEILGMSLGDCVVSLLGEGSYGPLDSCTAT